MMSLGYFDFAVIIGYMVMLLWVGYRSSDNKDMKEYAVANKRYGLPILFMTFTASTFGGNALIGQSAEMYSVGILHPIMLFIPGIIGNCMMMYISKYFDKRFKYCLSSSDMIKKFFGEKEEVFSAIVYIIGISGGLAAQGMAAASFLSATTGVDYTISLVTIMSIVTIYSFMGGVKAVTITDVIQFCVIAIFIPTLATLALYHCGGLEAVISSIPAEKMAIKEHPRFWEYSVMIINGFLIFGLLSPVWMQRYLMAQHKSHIRKIFFMTIGMDILFDFMLFIIVFAVYKYLVAPNGFMIKDPKQIVSYAIEYFCFPGIKGIAIAGVLALIMSTADSLLHAASVLFSRNIAKPLIKKDIDEVKWARLITIVLGIASVFIAIHSKSIFSLIVIVSTCIGSTLGPPLLFSLCRLKSDVRSFWLTVITGAVSIYLIEFVFKLDELYVVLSSFASCAVYLASHRYFFGKWDYDEEEKDIEENQYKAYGLMHKKAPMWRGRPIKTITDAITHSAELELPISGYFGIFGLAAFVAPYFFWEHNNVLGYPELIVFRMLAAVMCVGLLFRNYWAPYMKKFLPVYWYLTIAFCLVFIPGYMTLHEINSDMWLWNCSLAIICIFTLVNWRAAIGVFITGGMLVMAGIFARHRYLGLEGTGMDYFHLLLSEFTSWHQMAYLFLSSTIVSAVFASVKDVYVNNKLAEYEHFSSTIAHEAKTPLAKISLTAGSLINVIESNVEGDLYDGTDDPLKMNLKESGDIHFFKSNIRECKNLMESTPHILETMLMTSKVRVPEAAKSHMMVSTCIETAMKIYPFPDVDSDRIVFRKNISVDFEIYTVSEFMENLFFNLIKNSVKYAFPNNVQAKIYITMRDNCVYFRDTGNGISPFDLPYIFNRYYSKSNTGSGIGLSFCWMVMRDLGGYIECKSEVGKYTEFILHFPKVIREDSEHSKK